MTEKILEEINNPKISIIQAGEMFDKLFLDPLNKDLVIWLFDWVKWLVREQKVKNAIHAAKWWLRYLKSTIT